MIEIFAVQNSDALDQNLFEALFNLVSNERKLRSKRFLRREDACRSVMGEALARYCIGIKENIPPESIIFKIGEHEKPYCELPKKTQFSISHSGTWVVCATDNQPIGIDVERIHDINMDIAQRFFSDREYSEIMAVPDQEMQKNKFFDFWTLKESYIKAIGKGLSCPLSSFSIEAGADRIFMATESDLPILNFKSYNLGVGYKCAVCAVHETFPLEVNVLSPQRLLSYFLA